MYFTNKFELAGVRPGGGLHTEEGLRPGEDLAEAGEDHLHPGTRRQRTILHLYFAGEERVSGIRNTIRCIFLPGIRSEILSYKPNLKRMHGSVYGQRMACTHTVCIQCHLSVVSSLCSSQLAAAMMHLKT